MPAQKEQVKSMFDAIAPRYDFLNHLLSFNIDKRWRKNVVEKLKSENPERILDIATGTGDLAFALSVLHVKEIIGVDISTQMLEIANKKAQQFCCEKKIKFVAGDAEHLTFEDNYFDAATIAFGLRNFENLLQGLHEAYRVLKGNGHLLILEFSLPSSAIIRTIYMLYFTKILPLIGKRISSNNKAYTYLPLSVKSFMSNEELTSSLKSVGFKTVEYTKYTFGVVTLYTASK